MKINKFLVTVVLYFKSGNSKKVDWIEDKLVKKLKQGNQEVVEGLTLEEAQLFFQGQFKEWKDEGAVISRVNFKGDVSIIPFSEVEYATVSITLIDDLKATHDEEEGKFKTIPEPPVRSIENHPAYKK